MKNIFTFFKNNCWFIIGILIAGLSFIFFNDRLTTLSYCFLGITALSFFLFLYFSEVEEKWGLLIFFIGIQLLLTGGTGILWLGLIELPAALIIVVNCNEDIDTVYSAWIFFVLGLAFCGIFALAVNEIEDRDQETVKEEKRKAELEAYIAEHKDIAPTVVIKEIYRANPTDIIIWTEEYKITPVECERNWDLNRLDTVKVLVRDGKVVWFKKK